MSDQSEPVVGPVAAVATGSKLRPGEIKIKRLGKRYWISSVAEEPLDRQPAQEDPDDDEGGQRSIWALFRRRTEMWALRDVSLHITPGERVGIIGANGSGKSTLTRILSRTMPPSEGSVLGAGLVIPFESLKKPLSDDSSGLANLRMIGRLLDIPSETLENRLDDILDFSEIGQLAFEKVSRYSDQLYTRLAMAMGLMVEADIFIIDDEVKPGDPRYRPKFHERFSAVLEQGATLVYASNSLGTLRQLCNRLIWLHEGRVVADGEPGLVVERFLSTSYQPSRPRPGKTTDDEDANSAQPAAETHSGRQLQVLSDWLIKVGKAEQSWQKRISSWREKEAPTACDESHVTIDRGPGRLGTLNSVLCLTADGKQLVRSLPGERIALEIWTETFSQDVRISVALSFIKNGIVVFTSEPLMPLEAVEPGQYLFRTEIDGNIFAWDTRGADCAFAAKVLFSETENSAGETANARVAFALRGDPRVQTKELQHLERGGALPDAEPGAPERRGANGAAATGQITAAGAAGVLQEPILRPRLQWMAYRLCEGERAANEEAGPETELEVMAS